MVRLLQDHGFALDRVNGSHHIMVKDGVSLSVPVHGKKELKTGLAIKLLKEAGLK